MRRGIGLFLIELISGIDRPEYFSFTLDASVCGAFCGNFSWKIKYQLTLLRFEYPLRSNLLGDIVSSKVLIHSPRQSVEACQ